MKIAVITGTFFPSIGGAELVVHNLMKSLTARGVDATLCIPSSNYRKIDAAKFPYKILSFYIPKGLGRALNFSALMKGYVYLIKRQLERNGAFDIWHGHDAKFAGYYLAHLDKSNTLLTFHGSDIQLLHGYPYGLRRQSSYEKFLQNYMVKRISRFTALSTGIERELMDIGCPVESIVSIPNGIDPDLFNNIKIAKTELKRKNRFSEGDFIILTSGRNHPKKGYRYIPKIAKELEDRGVDFKWIVVGRNTQNLEPEIEKLGVSSIILKEQIGAKVQGADEGYTFPDESLRKIYKMVDCYVFPTLLEGLPIVILEAFASRLPVVTTDADGVRDFKGCIKIQRDREMVKGFVENIVLIKENSRFRDKIIEEQLKELKERFCWDVVVDKYVDTYRDMILENSNC